MLMLIAVILLIGSTTIGFLYLSFRVRKFSKDLFGTTDIKKVARDLQIEESTTPKSVSAMTSIYLPQIVKDFPDFNYNEMKSRANSLLISYLRSIDSNSLADLKYANEELKIRLEKYLQMLNEQNIHENYDMIKIHQSEIMMYKKTPGRCVVTFQIALECMHSKERDGKLLSGSTTYKYQTKYNVDMVYIQNRDIVENDGERALGINCPNCGAPISMIGKKYCEYCGTGVEEYNIKAWSFSAVEEYHR